MKKYLLTLLLLLLFPADAMALSCGARQYLSVSTCGEGTEQCNSCPSGCSSCSGINYSTSCQYWDREQGVIHTYATTTIGSCDSCDSGYELKRYTTGSYDGSTYRAIPYYSCERETIRCPSNCSSCSSSSTCTACAGGYTLSNGACVKTPTCSAGQYVDSDGSCRPCSNIPIPNGTCLSCSSSSQCDNISCNSGYAWMSGQTCTKAVTCAYPLKEATDYSGECVGCCTD